MRSVEWGGRRGEVRPRKRAALRGGRHRLDGSPSGPSPSSGRRVRGAGWPTAPLASPRDAGGTPSPQCPVSPGGAPARRERGRRRSARPTEARPQGGISETGGAQVRGKERVPECGTGMRPQRQGQQTGRELRGSLPILLFAQGGRKRGHQLGVRGHTTPPSFLSF